MKKEFRFRHSEFIHSGNILRFRCAAFAPAQVYC
uniref:Uncharacterized protein n=1 Tax=Setaria italica TaxID=4555 RepID=K3XTH0_SETIT